MLQIHLNLKQMQMFYNIYRFTTVAGWLGLHETVSDTGSVTNS